MSQVADPFAAAYDRLTAGRDPFADAYDKIMSSRTDSRPDLADMHPDDRGTESSSLSPSAGALPQGGAPVSSSPTVPPEAYVGGGFRLPGGPMRAPTPRDPTLDELMDAQGVPNPTSSIERITGTAVSTGAQALGLAGSRWRDVLTGKRSLAEVVMLPDPAERGGGGGVPGLSAETVRGAGAAGSQANTVERFVGGLAGMGPGFTDPKAIAAMIVTHAPTGAVLGSGPVQGMLAVTAKRFGEPVAAAAETILSSTAGLGAFSGANAMLEGGDIGKATLEGAAQGAVLGGLMAPIAGVGAARGRTMPQDRPAEARPTDTARAPEAPPEPSKPIVNSLGQGESAAVGTTPAEQAIATSPPDSPTLTRAARTGDIIHLAFDATGPVPDPKTIKADLRAKGHEAEVVKFQTDFVSGANGLTEYRIDVRGGEEKAAAVYRDLTGGDEQIVNRSTFEGVGNLDQRMQAAHAVMGEELGLGKGKKRKPWEMARGEYISENMSPRLPGELPGVIDYHGQAHKAEVRAAIERGDPVKETVTDSYPDLPKGLPSEKVPPVQPKVPPLRPQEGGPQGQTAQAGGGGVQEGGRAEPVPEAGEVKPEPVPTSARKAMVDSDREAMGLDILDSPERRSMEAMYADAKAQGIPEKADRIAAEVNAKPRALSDTETAGLVVRTTALKNEHRALTEKVGASTDPADIATNAAEARRVEQEFDALTTALRVSGTEKGRALASQKLTLDQDFNLLVVKNRAKVAKGAALSPAESKRLETLTTQLQESQAKVTELETAMQEQIAERAVRRHAAGKRATNHQARTADFGSLLAEAKALIKAGCR